MKTIRFHESGNADVFSAFGDGLVYIMYRYYLVCRIIL